MKFLFALTAATAVGLFGVNAAENVHSAAKSIASGAVLSTKGILNRPVGLVNKNNVIFGNNIFISRSKLIFTQNDRFALINKVEGEVKKETGAATAVITKNVLRAVSAPKNDGVLMTKASAVVAAKNDPAMLTTKIADFVDSAAKLEMDREAKHDVDIPRDVKMLIGTKTVLAPSAGVINKNVALSDDQLTLTRSQIAPTANDKVTLKDDAKVAGVIAPQSRIRLGSINVSKTETEREYRMAFVYPKTEMKNGRKEFCGWGLGWRYPLGWWGLHGGFGGCGLGFASGPWFFC